MVMQSYLTRK